MTTHNEPARLAASPEDYARFKLAKRHIEPWEDGLRLDPAAPNIEWWYFDCLLDDGANLAVEEGTYSNPAGENASIDKNAVIKGGWNSNFTSQVSVSVLDGLDANRAVSVLAGVTASLDRFTIQGGSSDQRGAGVQNDGSLTLQHCLVAQNNAGMDGGGIINQGSLIVEDSQLEDNHSGSVGGAILNNGSLQIMRTIFQDNSAGGWGGAILSLGPMVLEDCRVERGSAA